MSLKKTGLMTIVQSPTTAQMAARAAQDFVDAAKNLLSCYPTVAVVFSGAQSQGEFHTALRRHKELPWNRLVAFSVDEFVAPGIPAHLRVSAQPQRDLYSWLPFHTVHVLDPDAHDTDAERRRYEQLLALHPPLVACLGVGLSGHVALNEPGADFHDPQVVRLVQVCDDSKRQLERDPNFAALGTIPSQGLTITLPTLMAAERVLVVVPYSLKSGIIKRLIDSPVTPELPASLLKTHPNATLYLDAESGFLLEGGKA